MVTWLAEFLAAWAPVKRCHGGIVASIALMASSLACAQATDASQLSSIFNGLTSDQQAALLQQVSNSTGAGAGAGAQAQAQRQRVALSPEAQRDLLPPASQPLRAGDTVLVDVEIAREHLVTLQQQSPAQVSASGQATVQESQPDQLGESKTSYVRNSGISSADLAAAEKLKLEQLVKLIRERNPYLIDRNGKLNLPGFDGIAVAGLTQELATKRVSADGGLVHLDVKLTHLPLSKSGLAALKPFGYDLFENAQSSFAPQTDLPVPADYVVGPGDELSVQLYGSQNRTTRLTVSRDGTISFPELGPIEVGGKSFSVVREEVSSRISRQLIGVHANVVMGQMRSIRVFVLGEVKSPGSYTVSGMATMTSGLFASGGVQAIASLRDVQLKRQGKLVRRLDLYDLLMRGDTSNDAGLLAGDVIFVPPAGHIVSIDGEVQRPGIYELRNEGSLADLIALAGGYTPNADVAKSSLTRVDDRQQRVVLQLASGMRLQPQNGDQLHIAALRPTLDSGITIEGEVFRLGNFAWRAGLRLADVISSVKELKPGADQHYVLVRREVPPDRRIAVLSADLAAALADPRSPANIALEPNDRIMVFDLGAGRERTIKPLVDELRLQAKLSEPVQLVRVSGRVRSAGDYPLESGMRVGDLIRAAANLEDAAYGGKAELSRYVVENGQARKTQVIDIDLASVLKGVDSANVTLQPYDVLYVKEISGWSEQEQVVLKGEVLFPGEYPIRRGETLREVIDRAGGLTELAFAQGSVFTRLALKNHEQEQLDRLSERLQTDLAAMSLMAARTNQSNVTQSFTVGQSLLTQIKAARAVGRLVIDLPAIVSAPVGSVQDVALRNGDELIVPKLRQEVTVMGEVQAVTSHLYHSGRTRDDYIALSGGTTRQADRNKIYVVRANGSMIANGSGFLFRAGTASIKPGDTIVVPLDTTRIPNLPLFQSITQILSNIAISVAAIRTF